MADVQLVSAGTFLSELGVDTHIPYTDGGYVNIQNVISDLKYLGITQVRDSITNGQNGSAPLSSYVTLAQAGIHFTFVTEQTTTAGLQSYLSLIDQLEEAVPGSVTAIEGANEINNAPLTYNGVSGLQGALNLQTDIYTYVHADPHLAGVSVDYFTGYGTYNIAEGPDPSTTAGLADYDTQHPYPNYGQAPAFWVNRGQALSNTTNANAPAVYTETGYSTNQVDASVQAKYTLDLLLDTAQQNIAKTYLYQLMDAYAPGSPQGDDGFGQFDYTKAAKPVANAVHDLTTLLQDSNTGAASFKPTALNYTISGLPADGSSMVLEKSNGTYTIAVWAEPQIWNNTTNTEVAAPAENVTITLPLVYSSIEVYDPLSGTTAIASATNSKSVTIAVTDHPLLVQLGTTVAQQTAPAATTLVPVSAAGTLGATALVTYNWNPSTQLTHFLAALAQVKAGTKGARAKIVALGDSTTRGFGSAATDWTSLSYPMELAKALSGDGIAAQSDNFVGGPVSGGVADARETLVNGATNPWVIDAGGTTIGTTAAGQGFDFTLKSPGTYDRVDISYVDLGSGSMTVAVDGGPVLATVKFGNTGQTLTQTIDIPAGSHQVLSLRATNANPTYVQGASFWDTSTPSVEVYNAGIGGWTSTSANTSTYNGGNLLGSTNGYGDAAGAAALKPNLTLINLGINDILQDGGNGDAADLSANVATIVTNITQIVASLRSVGSDAIIIIPQAFSNPHYATEMPLLRNALQTLSNAQNVPIIDLSATYGSNYQTLLADGLLTTDNVHPDATLYADIGSQIAGLLASAATVPVPPPPPADTVVLNLSEDAYLGNAQFTVTIDGKQVGGIQSVTALRSAGQGQNFTLTGNFGSGAHVVGVDFINNAYGGSATLDRNLYVNAISWDGVTTLEHGAQLNGGMGVYNIATPTAASQAAAAAVASGTQGSLVLNISEDAYNGNAQFVVNVDGHFIGGPQTVTALHNAVQSQTFTYAGTFGAGPHTVAVDFLNDAYGGNAAADRNLYVNSISLNGETTVENAAQFAAGVKTYIVQSPGQMTFIAQTPAPTPSGVTLQAAAGTTLVGSTAFGDVFSGTAAVFYDDVLKNFGGSDKIDITDIAAGSVKSLNWAANAGGGVLTVTGASKATSFTLAGSFTADKFVFAPDAASGTLIRYTG